MRVGYLGGSFDPIHLGHLVLAQACREGASLDRIVLVVAGQPPHKPGRCRAEAADRLEMARRAVAGIDGWSVDDRETRRTGPSYTFDTVKEILAESAPGDEAFWLIGSDTLPDLPGWHRGIELLDRVGFVSASRPGHDVEAALTGLRTALGAARVDRLAQRVVPMPAMGISSTDVRARIAAGRSIRFLVPEPVREWIRERGLYRP